MTRTLYSDDSYIDAVMDLENKMDKGDMPHFERTVFGAEHFDTILVAN